MTTRIFKSCARSTGLLLAFVIPSVSAHAQVVLRVDADAAAGGNGAAWETAYNTLDSALSDPAIATAEVQIWLADGTYTPSNPRVAGEPRSASFVVPNGVEIYGGFDGTESALEQRDPASHQSILTGDLLGNDDGTALSLADNAHNVVVVDTDGGSVQLEGLRIRAGASESADGSLILVIGSTATIRACEFSNGTAFRGGAVAIMSESHATFDECTFRFNAASSGGAMSAMDASSAAFVRCLFDRNRAEGFGASGGAIEGLNSALTLESCRFWANSADSNGGGISLRTGSSLLASNCVFAGNETTSPVAEIAGGAIAVGTDASLQLINATVVGNRANKNVGGGIGIAADAADIQTISNSILRSNESGGFRDEIAQVFDGTFPLPVINQTCIEGLTTFFGGSGNVDVDPVFVDADGEDGTFGTDDDDFRIRAGSPLIDEGDNSLVVPGIITDINGLARFFDGDMNGTTIVDIGAHESDGTLAICMGDCDGSGEVNFSDLVAILNEFGTPGPSPACDNDQSGIVDFSDLVSTLGLFGPCSQ